MAPLAYARSFDINTKNAQKFLRFSVVTDRLSVAAAAAVTTVHAESVHAVPLHIAMCHCHSPTE